MVLHVRSAKQERLLQAGCASEGNDMLHTENTTIRSLLMKGKVGLEKESLRIDSRGYMAQTPHPFPGDSNIVRDFSENQTEINTPAADSAGEALALLMQYDRKIKEAIGSFDDPEYLWPFSNPPYIKTENDIPIARYYGDEAEKTLYRNYLAHRYGRYKMTFSGIHYNYSFSEELLRAEFALQGETDWRSFKDQFYVSLAERMEIYGWLMVAVTAASPLLDSSFVAKGILGETLFTGLASVRCSELGYWNFFTPVLNYSNLEAYADSILRYVDQKLIRYPSELYFPIRLKPDGKYDFYQLKSGGVGHIELRMIDLNPLAPAGVDLRDVQFAELLLIWAASLEERRYDENDHMAAVQNFKTAAHYDLKTVHVIMPGGESLLATDAALHILQEIETFYSDFPDEVRQIIAFQKEKFVDGDKRYAWKVKELFQGRFVEKGLEWLKDGQFEQTRDDA